MTDPTIRPTFSPTRPRNRFPHSTKKRADPPGTGTTTAKHTLIPVEPKPDEKEKPK